MEATRRVVLAVAVVALIGCDRDDPPEPKPTASASASPAAALPPRCALVERGASFTIGERPAATGDGGSDDIALPFAVELGSAAVRPDGFAVSGQRTEAGKTLSFVALVGKRGASGRLVELGRVHGGAEPPRLAAKGARLVAAVPDSDAAGGTLRLASISDAGGRVDVTWGAEVSEGHDQSPAFDVALGGDRGALVWDVFDKKAGKASVLGASFSANDVSNVTRERRLSPEDDDAEMPRLVARPGGFWLAWISGSPPADEKTSDAGSPAPPQLLELGRRALKLMPLDANAAPTASPIAITRADAHVLVYDLAVGPRGHALLAWRDDDTAPGAEARTVYLAKVAAGGGLDTSRIENEEVGAGVPVLLVPPGKPPAKLLAWLALAGLGNATRLGNLSADLGLGELAAEPVVNNAEPLAARDDQLLIAQPRGLAAELSVVRCTPR